MAKIPWFSHFGHLATDITFINVVSSPIGIALWALAVSFATGVADPIGISAPVDSIVVVPILRPIDLARPVPLTVGPATCHLKLQWIYHPPHGGMPSNDAGFDALDEVFSRLLDFAVQPVPTAYKDGAYRSFGVR